VILWGLIGARIIILMGFIRGVLLSVLLRTTGLLNSSEAVELRDWLFVLTKGG